MRRALALLLGAGLGVLMAITRIAGSGGAGASVTFAAHQAGDLILVCAYRDGSNTAPSLPTGWTNIHSGGANTTSARLAYRIATGPGTTSGTWTNASRLMYLIYRGADQTTPIGGWSIDGLATHPVWYWALNGARGGPAMQVTDGTSWVAAMIGHRSVNTALGTAPTGMTNCHNVADATCEVATHDTNAGVASWSDQSVDPGGTASGWRSYTVEIRAAAGAGGITGTSSTTLALGRTEDADVLVTGSHNETQTLGRTEAGSVLVQAGGSRTFALTSQAAGGSPAVLAEHSASLTLAHAAATAVRVTATASRVLVPSGVAQGGSPALNADAVRLLTLAGLAAGAVTGEGIPEPPPMMGGGRLKGLRPRPGQHSVLVANARAELPLMSEAQGVEGRGSLARGQLTLGGSAAGRVDGLGDDEIALILEALS